MPDRARNVGASVRARLLNLARRRNQPLDLLLTRFVLERLLYRLSKTKHRERFVLKGAMLMTAWFDSPYRPTRDLDLLGTGDPNPTAMLKAFGEICAVEMDDGVEFDVSALTVDRVREESAYGGLRIRTYARLGGARIRVMIDVGFGDAIEPGVAELELPALLDFPRPRLRAYPRETVIAEKLHALILFGRANTRMKDLYDIWMLSRTHEYLDENLPRAIAATFARRNTPIPVKRPDALTRAYAEDPAKQQQWASFAASIEIEAGSLAALTAELAEFLMPHLQSARSISRS